MQGATDPFAPFAAADLLSTGECAILHLQAGPEPRDRVTIHEHWC